MRILPAGIASLCAVAILAATGCGVEPAAETVAPQPALPRVEVVTLSAEPWRGTIQSFGVIEALEEVDIAAEISGTVSAVYVDEGDAVETGQLLLELDGSKQNLALEAAREQAAEAKAALQEAELRLRRRQDLAARESISKEVLDSAQLAVDGAAAGYQKSIASMRLAERHLADTQIVSPAQGLIDLQYVEPGESVTAGASLIKMQVGGGLRLQTWVSEADVLKLSAGAKAVVSASGIPGQTYPAVVEWVGVKADGDTGNFPVKLILQSGAQMLRPGMTATAALETETIDDALILPESALVDRNRRRVVYVVDGGRVYEREPLLAAGLSDHLLVLNGLESGQTVVVGGHSLIVDGVAVQVSGED